MSSSKLVQRLMRLAELTEVTADRVSPELTEDSLKLSARASSRLRAGSQTVVALAGATGAGKSSLFNALTGETIAEQGPRRPTTSQTLAVSFGATNAELLDLLEVKRRVEVPPNGVEDLVLLDLPDHDSTERAHQDEVDRMVPLVDQFIWVMDPQKYADAAVHERYLRPLAPHRDVITIVMNQADRLSRPELEACLRDLQQQLVYDGLEGVPIFVTSALTGWGVPELRKEIAQIVSGKRAVATRISADLDVIAARYREEIPQRQLGKADGETVTQLVSSLEQVAGVPIVTRAVRDAMVHRGNQATGWPVVSWLSRFRPDPLRRLRLAGPGDRKSNDPVAPDRSSVPRRSSVADSQLKTCLRQVSDELAGELPGSWRESVTAAVYSNEETLPDGLDRIIVGTELTSIRPPFWWQLLRFLQWFLISLVVIGLGWLALNAVLGFLGLGELSVSSVGDRISMPTLLVIGGVLGGIVLAASSAFFVSLGARNAERVAKKRLHGQIAALARTEILDPARTELEHYQAALQLTKQLT